MSHNESCLSESLDPRVLFTHFAHNLVGEHSTGTLYIMEGNIKYLTVHMVDNQINLELRVNISQCKCEKPLVMIANDNRPTIHVPQGKI